MSRFRFRAKYARVCLPNCTFLLRSDLSNPAEPLSPSRRIPLPSTSRERPRGHLTTTSALSLKHTKRWQRGQLCDNLQFLVLNRRSHPRILLLPPGHRLKSRCRPEGGFHREVTQNHRFPLHEDRPDSIRRQHSRSVSILDASPSRTFLQVAEISKEQEEDQPRISTSIPRQKLLEIRRSTGPNQE